MFSKLVLQGAEVRRGFCLLKQCSVRFYGRGGPFVPTPGWMAICPSPATSPLSGHLFDISTRSFLVVSDRF